MLKAFYFEDASYRVEFRFNDACLVLSVLLIYWSLWVNTLMARKWSRRIYSRSRRAQSCANFES